MLIGALNTKNPAYNADLYEDYWALYAGGETFRKRVHRFLPQNFSEPNELYEARKSVAVYRSYIAAVADYFGAMMFGSGKLEMVPKDMATGENLEAVPDPVLEYLGDCDGAGTDFVDQMRQWFLELMTRGGGAIAVDFPGLHSKDVPTTVAEYEALGWNNIKTKLFNRTNIYDWEKDSKGNLEWIVLYEKRTPRQSWQEPRNKVEHVWLVYDREFVYEYVYRSEPNAKVDAEKQAILEKRYRHAKGYVPVVYKETPNQLWIADKLESAQKEHFQLSCAQNWGIRRSCFTQPVIKSDQDVQAITYGAGYAIKIATTDDVNWLSPDVKYLEYTQREIKSQKDEIYRAIGQMSLSMDNTAIVVGRSAESKMADAESVRTLLNAYGSLMRNQAEVIMKMVSDGMNMNLTWAAQGLDRAVSTDPIAFLGALLQAKDAGITSPTFWRLAHMKAAVSCVPEATYDERDNMRKEIEQETPDFVQALEDMRDALVATEQSASDPVNGSGGTHSEPGSSRTATEYKNDSQKARAGISGDAGASISAAGSASA